MRSSWQFREFSGRFAKTAIIVQKTNWGKNLYQKRKTLYFSRFWVSSLFLLIPQKFARVFKTATFLALEEYEEKQFSKLCTMFKPSSDSEPKSITFSRKVSFGIVTTAIRASRGLFCGKSFFPENFFCIKFGAPATFLLLGKYLI